MSEVRACNCDPSQCKRSDRRRHVHVGDECYHPNNIHHKIKLNFVNKTNLIDENNHRRRNLVWNI